MQLNIGASLKILFKPLHLSVMSIWSPKQPGTIKGEHDLKSDIPGFQEWLCHLLGMWSSYITFELVPASVKMAFYGVLGRSNKNSKYERV